jgi:hypothetical protein
MRSNIGQKGRRPGAFTTEHDRMAEMRAASPDQMSVVWAAGNVASASPQSAGVGGSYSLDIVRYPAGAALGEALNLRRTTQLGLPALSQRTVLSTTVSDYSERTRVLALTGEQLAMRNDELAQWLIEAERRMTRGTDDHPLFETSIEDTVCAIGRLPNGQVAMTEVPRANVNAIRERFRSIVPGATGSTGHLTIETPVRSVARYFLTAMPEGEQSMRPSAQREVTAFLLIGREGFSWGLWAPAFGLFSEYSFLAPKDVWSSAEAAADDPALNAYVHKAFDQLNAQLTSERLDELGSHSYAQVVVACEPGLGHMVAETSREFESRSGIEYFQIPVPADEAAAAGLLFGTFAFGDTAPAGAQLLPQVDLSQDLLALADSEEVERREMQERQIRRQRSRAALALLAAPVMAAAVLLALTASLFREQIGLAIRESRADAQTVELKPALDRRRSYEANLKWYQEFITQVSALRRQQPVGIGLLHELNKTYPMAGDPSFYVSEMKLNPSGALELRGLSRNKDAIAVFLKSLEFAGGAESGSRLFGNLAYEVQEGTVQQTPNVPGATLAGATVSNAPPGVVAWSLRGNYVPMAEFAPPDPNKKPAVPPPATGAAPAAPAAPAAN